MDNDAHLQVTLLETCLQMDTQTGWVARKLHNLNPSLEASPEILVPSVRRCTPRYLKICRALMALELSLPDACRLMVVGYNLLLALIAECHHPQLCLACLPHRLQS